MSEFLKVCGEYISMYLSLIFYSQTLLIFAESLSLVFSSYEIETTHVGLFLFGDFSLSGHVVFFSFRLGPLLSKEFFWGHSFSPKLCFYLLKIKVSPADAVSLLSPPSHFSSHQDQSFWFLVKVSHLLLVWWGKWLLVCFSAMLPRVFHILSRYKNKVQSTAVQFYMRDQHKVMHQCEMEGK